MEEDARESAVAIDELRGKALQTKDRHVTQFRSLLRRSRQFHAW